VILSVCSLVGVNLVFPNYGRDPTILHEILNSFAFIIIDFLRSERLNTRFFAPKLIFFRVLLVVEIVYPILHNRWELLGVAAVPHGLVLFVYAARLALYAAFVIWFAVLAATMCQKLRQTELFKLNTYSFVFAGAITPNITSPSSETAPGSLPSISHHLTHSCSS
jgi:hypothetical protein